MKKLISIVLAVLFCLSFAACTGKQPVSDPTAKPTAEAATTAEVTELAETTEEVSSTDDSNIHFLTYEEVFDPETDFDNYLGHYYSTLLNTEDAYYFCGLRGQYLYYYDKQTGESDVLCPKPECMHDNDSDNATCGGYLGAKGTKISLYRNKIYFASYHGTVQSLFRMNTDGTEREKLFDFEYSIRYDPQWFAIHRGKLYGVQWGQIVEDAVPMDFWNVTCWDIETGEWKVVCEGRDNTEPSLFFFGKDVYVSVSYVESSLDENYEPVYGDVTVKIFRYDTKTEQLETIVGITGPDYAVGRYALCVAAENKIYAAPTSYWGTAPVYLVSNEDLKELFSFKSYGCISLYTDKVVLGEFEQPIKDDPHEMRWHFKIMDYEGGVLHDETVALDTVAEISDSINNISYVGVYEADGALFAVYCLWFPRKADGTSPRKTCLVKYELIDGKLEDTLIAVTKWE